MSLAKILIVEDEVTIACDIAFNLEANDFEIVDVVYSAEDAIPILEEKAIDLVMLDINLSGELSGLDLAETLDLEYDIPFIFLTSYSDNDTIQKASKTFPASYLVKPFKENDLAPAVKIALASRAGDKNLRMPALRTINQASLSKITKSEYKVMSLFWEGKSNPEIAKELFLSKNTIKTHSRNIYLKLDLNSKYELMSFLQGLK